MRNFKISFLVFIIIFISCNNSKDEGVNKQSISDNNSNKNFLKQKIFESYSKIPEYVFYENESTDYNNYEEFIHLDSLLNVFEEKKKTEIEHKNLLILRYKRYLLTGNYKEAIETIKEINESNKNEDIIQLYLAFAYEFNNEISKSKEIYEALSLRYIRDKNCDKLSLISALTNNQEHIEEIHCDFNNYNSLKLMSTKKIVYEYFLKYFEL